MVCRLVNSCRGVASSLSSWESVFMKTVKHFTTDLNPSSEEEIGIKSTDKERRKRYAILCGYHGEKYHGVCLHPGQDHVPTVGKEVARAMIKVGYMDECCLQSAKTMSQVSRTDAGVSALKQILVVDLRDTINLDKVQQYLSADIQLYGITRTIKNFVPFRHCWGRSYLYYIPSYVFAPLSIEMHNDYRLTNEATDKIKRTLGKFLGKQNYHNFTKSRSFNDPRAVRKINKVELLEPVIVDGMELVCVRLEGESFILNQIRKIIGALVVVGRGYVPEEMIDVALSKQGMEISRAPPCGLMLEDVNFDTYNAKFDSRGFSPIDFSKYEAQVQALKDRILSGIVATEMKYETTKLWVESLQYLPFQPYSREQRALDSTLAFDDTLNIVRSENVTISGKNAAALFI